MNRMSRNVKFAYVIISILHTSRADVQLTAVAGRPYSANFSVGVIDLFPAVWTEYITSSAGSNILQQGFPLEGPRQSRYNQTYSTGNGKTELMFTEVQLDDGGRYVFTISVGTGTFETVVDILVVDDMVCNVTELHVVTDGETITYTCSYKYQGLMVPNKTKWEGAGVSISCCKVSNWTREAVPLAPPGSCYTGNATFSVSLKVSPALNGTRHSCTIYDDSGNAEGVRFITEMLKAGGEVTMGALTEIFEGIWETEETPGDWKMGLIVKLPKKGDLSLFKNCRVITLLSITSKVFSRMILDRISEALDPLLRKERAGFRKGKSCGDHIFTLRQILEQCHE
ncbi:hypothetical protein LSAT2_030866 [Lamellibrachia satsuma]|nr:hypothetical protein LSAT2_030866 [Lamellibrachia satsuma]